MNHRKAVRMSSAILAAVLIVWATSCATNPVTQEREFMLLSQSDELALGRQTDPKILQTYGHYQDPELAEYVNAIGQFRNLTDAARINVKPQRQENIGKGENV